MAEQLIGARIKALREKRGLSQDSLAQLFGFKDRQTVSAIETGLRRVTAEELVLAVEKLGAPLEYFTDPFLLVGEGRFSWRRTGVDAGRLEEYERHAGRWIASFRFLAPRVGRRTPLMRRALALTRHSRFEDAMQAGDRFAAEFGLGDEPATRLAEVMEQDLGIMVLMVDACDGISGAACRLPELDAVLIARREVPGRRHFDLAHELFHILTWDAMPPEHCEEARGDRRQSGRAAGQQLRRGSSDAARRPGAVRGLAGAVRAELIARLNAAANALGVTATALKWRLVALGELKPATARSLPEEALRNNEKNIVATVPPPLFSKPFAEVIGLAIDAGHVSVRRMAGLLQLAVETLPSCSWRTASIVR